MAGDSVPVRMLITSGKCSESKIREQSEELARLAIWAAENRIDFFQVREKQLSARSLFYLTQRLVELARGGLRIIVNGRFDVALAAGAAGVHLPGDSLPVAAVRASLPDGFIIGVSTHSIAEVQQAAVEGADYALFGPVFATPGKGKPTGTEALKEAVAKSGGMPVIALGGIDGEKIGEVLRAGAAGFAAIRYFQDLAGVQF